MFRSVTYQNLQGPIASVDRSTGDLFIDPVKWNQLSKLHRDYVLLHEEGHIKLQTANEFEANRYAIDRFMNLGTLSNEDLSARMVVLSDLLETERPANPDPDKSDFWQYALSLFSGVNNQVNKWVSNQNQKSADQYNQANQSIQQRYNLPTSNSQTRIFILVALIVIALSIGFIIIKKTL